MRDRIAWMDLARVGAIAAVVAVHVVAPLVRGLEPAHKFWAGNLIDSASRWAVPVFIMLSGALLLDPGRAESATAFYRRRLVRIGLPLVVWTLAYLAWSHGWDGSTRTLEGDIRLVLAGRPYYHLYFLFVMLGLYLITPLVAIFTRAASQRELAGSVALLLGLGMANSLLAGWFGVGGGRNAATHFIPFVGFFMAGTLLARMPRPTRRTTVYAIGIALAGVALTAFGVRALAVVGGIGRAKVLYDNLSLTTVPTALAVFVLFRAAVPEGWAAGTRPQRRYWPAPAR